MGGFYRTENVVRLSEQFFPTQQDRYVQRGFPDVQNSLLHGCVIACRCSEARFTSGHFIESFCAHQVSEIYKKVEGGRMYFSSK